MMTRSGRKFYPFDPKAKDISLFDIASGLASMTRYNGQAPVPYTVAQHAMLAATLVERIADDRGLEVDCDREKLLLAALHHDSAEAYLPDVIRPYKSTLNFYLEEGDDGFGQYFPFKVIEERIQKEIFRKWDLPWPIPEAVKVVDDVMLATELALFWPRQWKEGVFDTVTEEPLGVIQVLCDFDELRRSFSDMHLRHHRAQ